MPPSPRHPAGDDRAVVRHLYVHVPFCPTICPFCSFHVLERRSGAVASYLRRLDDQLGEAVERLAAAGVAVEPETVYLGGGTPSHLRVGELAELRSIVERRVGWGTPGSGALRSFEATLEVHPSTATEDRARDWVDLGFTRLSVGVQSFDDEVLARLGRPHDAAAGRAAVEWCRSTEAITSLDLIVAVEGQDVVADLEAAVATGVDHVSAYTLTIEPDTPFDRAGVVVPDDRAAAALGAAARVLGGAGYERYEVSNHARPGARCAHNQGYWTGAWYLGVGPSASSFLPGAAVPATERAPAVRTREADWGDWLAGAAADAEVVDGRDLLGDALLCGLRLLDGVDLDDVARRTGLDARVELGAELDVLAADGLITVDGARLRATEEGVMVLDRVAATLL